MTLAGGCLRLANGTGDYLVIRPPGVHLDEKGGGIRVIDETSGRMARLGGTVRLAGTEIEPPSLPVWRLHAHSTMPLAPCGAYLQGAVMKKQAKKLVLGKETVRSLELGRVAGGESDFGCILPTWGCPTGGCTEYCPSNRVACKQ